jgi:hypothetical protein
MSNIVHLQMQSLHKVPDFTFTDIAVGSAGSSACGITSDATPYSMVCWGVVGGGGSNYVTGQSNTGWTNVVASNTDGCALNTETKLIECPIAPEFSGPYDIVGAPARTTEFKEIARS